MKKCKLSNVRQGRTVYCVFALGRSSHITTMFITGKPFVFRAAQGSYRSIRIPSNNVGTNIDNAFSAKDVNLIPNKYNKHRAFFSSRKAKRYLEKCISENINLHSMHYFEDDDFNTLREVGVCRPRNPSLATPAKVIHITQIKQ